MTTPAACTHSFPDPFPQPISQIGDCRGCGISYQEAKAAMTTPSEELRAVSARLRELATAASTDNDGAPTAHWNTAAFADSSRPVLCGGYRTRDDGRQISWPPLVRGGSPQRPSYMHTQHAEYAAAMGPAVGLALALLLEAVASNALENDHEECRSYCTSETCDVAAALTLARQINTGSKP